MVVVVVVLLAMIMIDVVVVTAAALAGEHNKTDILMYKIDTTADHVMATNNANAQNENLNKLVS